MNVPRNLKHDVSEETLDAVAAAVDAAESKTSGEVHVHLVHGLLPFEKPRSRAWREFHRLGIDKTKARNGVLVFAAMKARRFEILPDEAIAKKVAPEKWDRIAEQISARIHDDGFAEGLSHGIREIGALLAEHFPREPDDENELPDRPSAS